MPSSTEIQRKRRELEEPEVVAPKLCDEHDPSFDDEKFETPRYAEEPPDGGYGWIVVGCFFFLNAVTWGANASFGVFLSFYRQNDYFPGATDIDFAFVGGLCLAFTLLVAPCANYLSKRFNFKVPMIGGAVLFVLSQVFAGLSTEIWHLILTQGVMFGLGMGLLFTPPLSIVNQWFGRRRALAGGIAAGGTGAGGLVLSIANRIIIQRMGLKWAFFIDSFISLAVLTPVLILIKGRVHIINAKFEPIEYKLLWHPGFVFIWVWGFFSMFGFVFSLYSVATYSTSGLGLSQAQGANLQSILAAGQMIGRPLFGLSLDMFGRINLASFVTFLAGLSCLAIWLPARSYGVMILFSLVQGMFGGVFWSTVAPVTAEILGLSELGSAISVTWLSIVIPATLAEPVASWLLDYSHNTLHRTGADAFLIAIGLAGACFITASFVLLGAKRWKQGNWSIFTKT